MHSIRTKFTWLTVCEIIIVIIITGVLSTAAIGNLGNKDADQILFLLCEEGQKSLDAYFKSVEQSVEIVSSYAEEDLKNTELSDLEAHMGRVEDIFEKTANNTNGILTYYYRTDPTVNANSKGFWYVDLYGSGFKEHEVTDITLYDTKDQTSLVWFSVPKSTGHPVWLSPYFTDNLDVYVYSYNVPVYKGDTFVGVIGIEIDYNTIAAPVDKIKLYKSGCAFINDDDGNIVYHPRMEFSDFTGDKKPQVPEGMLIDGTHIKYTYDGVEKRAARLPLCNGMHIVVSVPISEIDSTWHKLLNEIILASLLLILIFVIFTLQMASRITRPLKMLTEAAARLGVGNYDFELDYDKDDEIGVLAGTFARMAGHLKAHIKELNDLAYSDPLTAVHNKGAFDIYIKDLQSRVDRSGGQYEFAVGIFDCNDLKQINDEFGHDKGDLYLKSAAAIICDVFSHSPVFRIGGDEFAVILQNNDYRKREELTKLFEKKIQATNSEPQLWKHISVAMGTAVFDPNADRFVDEVVRRADNTMYRNKWQSKKQNGNT